MRFLNFTSCLLAVIFFSNSIAFADIEILPENQQRCVDKKMGKWRKQRDRELEKWCNDLAKKGEECRVSAGMQSYLEEDAIVGFTKKCKQLIKSD